jgi:hypothetical protein
MLGRRNSQMGLGLRSWDSPTSLEADNPTTVKWDKPETQGHVADLEQRELGSSSVTHRGVVVHGFT